MHRTVKSDDVVDYTSHIPKDDVLRKDEDIEYRSGMLYHSTGRTSVRLRTGPRPWTQRDMESDSLLADAAPDRDHRRREAHETYSESCT